MAFAVNEVPENHQRRIDVRHRSNYSKSPERKLWGEKWIAPVLVIGILIPGALVFAFTDFLLNISLWFSIPLAAFVVLYWFLFRKYILRK